MFPNIWIYNSSTVYVSKIFIYFRIADRFNIIDKPNERSSHNYITIRGGGIIWWVAALLYLLFHF